ncbi:MAG: thioesterase family protein [Novosphingobium sp.]
MNFPESLSAAAPIEGGFALTVPEGWHQGRTAYGGFSSALALSAAQQLGGAGLPPLRSVAVSFVGPLYGSIEVGARLLRQGKNATWIAVEITRDGEVGMTATFVFMGSIASTVYLNNRPVPDGLIPVEQALPVPFSLVTPMFLKQFFEARFAVPRDTSTPPRAEVCWWVRLKDHGSQDMMAGLLLLADALPPGIMPLADRSMPVSSMNWQANLLSPALTTHDGWWLARSSADYAEHGCSSQLMDIWNAEGVPVMSGMQSIAVFG